MQKFNPLMYTRDHVMWCKTREQSDLFREFLNNEGLRWRSGSSYLALDHFGDYKTGICYRFTEGEYSSVEFYANHNYHILNFDDFDWGDDELLVSDQDVSAIDLFVAQFASKIITN